ncbi:MAG TPA: riboflavin synthase [Nitrospiria bacterium]|nr:riboflavin synthase [Nitrospiria bacterium]
MFTGIIEETGIVKKIERSAKSARLTVEARKTLSGIKKGESISVNGVCLTAVKFSAAGAKRRWFSADISRETLGRTLLGALKPGDRVNLERAARMNERIGGHLVSGHVDGVGLIRKIEPVEASREIYLALPLPLMRYCVEKGSIGVDGISLTINRLDRKGVYLMIIPHTLEVTTLGKKKVHDRANVEVDLIGKYIERLFPGR